MLGPPPPIKLDTSIKPSMTGGKTFRTMTAPLRHLHRFAQSLFKTESILITLKLFHANLASQQHGFLLAMNMLETNRSLFMMDLIMSILIVLRITLKVRIIIMHIS